MKTLLVALLAFGSFSVFAETHEVTVKCSLKNEETKVEDSAEKVISVDDTVEMDQDEQEFTLSIPSKKYGTVKLVGFGRIMYLFDAVRVSTSTNFSIPTLGLYVGSMNADSLKYARGDVAYSGSVFGIAGESYRYSCMIKTK